MQSAFGVDHGEFSKSLPRSLRVHAQVGHPVAIGWRRGGPADDYVTHRVAAHWYGKEAARAEGQKRKALKAGTAGRRVRGVVQPSEGNRLTETDAYGLLDARHTANRMQGKHHRDRSREING